MTKDIDKAVEKAIENHRNEYPVKLTWKQVYIGLAAITTVVGVIFSAGMKLQSGIDKVEDSKISVKHQQELAKLEEDKIGLNKDLTASKEDADFFKDRYTVSQRRLEECMHGIVYDSKSDNNTEINK